MSSMRRSPVLVTVPLTVTFGVADVTSLGVSWSIRSSMRDFSPAAGAAGCPIGCAPAGSDDNVSTGNAAMSAVASTAAPDCHLLMRAQPPSASIGRSACVLSMLPSPFVLLAAPPASSSRALRTRRRSSA
jgi:hypothetical protein